MDFLLHPATWLAGPGLGHPHRGACLGSRRRRAHAARSWLLLVGFRRRSACRCTLAFGHPWLSRERRERWANARG